MSVVVAIRSQFSVRLKSKELDLGAEAMSKWFSVQRVKLVWSEWVENASNKGPYICPFFVFMSLDLAYGTSQQDK